MKRTSSDLYIELICSFEPNVIDNFINYIKSKKQLPTPKGVSRKKFRVYHVTV